MRRGAAVGTFAASDRSMPVLHLGLLLLLLLLLLPAVARGIESDLTGRRLQTRYVPPMPADLVFDLCGDTCQSAANMGAENLALLIRVRRNCKRTWADGCGTAVPPRGFTAKSTLCALSSSRDSQSH